MRALLIGLMLPLSMAVGADSLANDRLLERYDSKQLLTSRVIELKADEYRAGPEISLVVVRMRSGSGISYIDASVYLCARGCKVIAARHARVNEMHSTWSDGDATLTLADEKGRSLLEVHLVDFWPYIAK
jgi:hypothetical protein